MFKNYILKEIDLEYNYYNEKTYSYSKCGSSEAIVTSLLNTVVSFTSAHKSTLSDVTVWKI